MHLGDLRVNCLAQEHNTMTRPGLEPRPLDLESSALTIRHRASHQVYSTVALLFECCTLGCSGLEHYGHFILTVPPSPPWSEYEWVQNAPGRWVGGWRGNL